MVHTHTHTLAITGIYVLGELLPWVGIERAGPTLIQTELTLA